MPILETDTLSNVDISSFLEVGSYTADINRSSLMMNVLVDNIAGSGNYEVYVTQQRGGIGSEYQSANTVLPAGVVTSIKFPSIILPILATDIIRIYLKGLGGDVSVDVISEFWVLDSPLGVGAITWPITITDGTNPLEGVRVWVSTDVEGEDVVALGYTNALGIATLLLDAGTYYCWKTFSGYTFTNPQVMIVDIGAGGSIFVGISSGGSVEYYGTATQVAYLARTWTRDGAWYNTVPASGELPEISGTNPSLSQVVNWLALLSSTVDMALAAKGFTVPITVTKALGPIELLVTSLVADLCHAANSSGRLYTKQVLERGGAVTIYREITSWVDSYADGIEALGALRAAISNISSIGYRSTDLEERLFGIWDL